MEKQVTKLRDQATKITDSSELSTSAKMQQLQKLYTSFGSHKKKAKSGKILVDFRTKKRIGGATRGKRVVFICTLFILTLLVCGQKNEEYCCCHYYFFNVRQRINEDKWLHLKCNKRYNDVDGQSSALNNIRNKQCA